MNKISLFCFRLMTTLFLLGGLTSCANMASPNGGPYDETPPKVISSYPKPNTINFKGKKVNLFFDEIVQIDKPSENVIVTPPQREMPIIQSYGKRIQVELNDTLLPNTTYTIDFTNSIGDNNEKNILQNYSFAFSTGEVIDSLQIAGTLLNAFNLEPMTGITIGLHKDLADSAFTSKPFVRTSRTDDRGHFTIRNVAVGRYRIYALDDSNRDYLFDQPGEAIAYQDSLVIPSSYADVRQDTIWKDSLTVDSIKEVRFTHFKPEDLVLFLFQEKFERQYLVKSERLDDRYFTLKFNAQMDTVPIPRPLNFEENKEWFFVQKDMDGKQIHYWLTDTMLLHQDTLRMEVTYPKSDSLNILRSQRDTLRLFVKKRKVEVKRKRHKGKKKEEEVEPLHFLSINMKPSGSLDVFDTVRITFDEPVLHLLADQLPLEMQVDSVWEPVSYTLRRDSLDSFSFCLLNKWPYETNYRLKVDSASITSVYGHPVDNHSFTFTTQKEDEYGHLYINISGVQGPSFVELLDNADKVVRCEKVKRGGVLFMNLKPAKYYARLIVDTNANGRWDTGNYAAKQQAEPVYYYTKFFAVMQNWKMEESWDVLKTSVTKQKPLEITKNKPKKIDKKKRDYRQEQLRNTRSRSSGMSGFGGF